MCFFSVFSVFGVRLGTGVPAGIGRDLLLKILKRKFFKSTKIKDILHLPQCAPETKLLMVLAVLRLKDKDNKDKDNKDKDNKDKNNKDKDNKDKDNK